MLVAEDLDIIVPQLVRQRIPAKWAGVFIGRTMPEATRPRAVLIQRSGGPFLDILRDQALMTVNVFGSTEQEVNDLAKDVRAVLQSLHRNPFKRVEVSGPAPVENSTPQRFMTMDLINRRSRT